MLMRRLMVSVDRYQILRDKSVSRNGLPLSGLQQKAGVLHAGQLP